MEVLDQVSYVIYHMPLFLFIGLVALTGFYFGRVLQSFKLPSILAYMLLGIALGPSGANILNAELQQGLSFIVQMTLGFIALHIGLELNVKSLHTLGSGMAWVILAETFGAAILVTTTLYLVTGNLPLALIFGAIAPASAPAGTVAVIQEARAHGPLTKALYAVVGFDDGLTIVIFGFAASLAKTLLVTEGDVHVFGAIGHSLYEILMVCVVGLIIALLFSYCVRPIKKPKNMLILTFCFVAITIGLSSFLSISMILTNMMLGFVMANTQPKEVLERISLRLTVLMPLLFILFFALAGASLHLDKMLTLGAIGGVYIAARSFGLMGGAWFGATVGKLPEMVKKYMGMGILSQAGVAIGLSLIIQQDFAGLGRLVQDSSGAMVPIGDYIGAVVLTTITATSIFFEFLGPILTRIALKKAGEVGAESEQ